MMTKDKKEMIISWLESNRGNGFFEGEPEEDMDFNKLDDEDLTWYEENWIATDREDEDSEKVVEKSFKIKYEDIIFSELKDIKRTKDENAIEEFHDENDSNYYTFVAGSIGGLVDTLLIDINEFNEAGTKELNKNKYYYCEQTDMYYAVEK